ncbi:MAG: hypothetical protein U0R26_02680 [Solirubrobacterales bacterium]
MPATSASASRAVAIPVASRAAAISGPRRAGSRRAMAISAGSVPAWTSLATSVAIASASPRVPAERSSCRPSPAGSGSAFAAPNPRARWKSRGLSVFAGSATVAVSSATPIRPRSSPSRPDRAASAALPGSNGSATVTSLRAASASISSNWLRVRSSRP